MLAGVERDRKNGMESPYFIYGTDAANMNRKQKAENRADTFLSYPTLPEYRTTVSSGKRPRREE